MAIEVGSAFVSIIPSFKGFGRELSRQLSAETAGVGAAAGQKISRDIGGSLKSAGDKTADFGAKLNKNVTLPIAGAGGLAFKAFADFDQTMRQVGVQTGLSGKGLQDFNALALKMGADTSFSAGEAASAMLELAKGGLTAAQIKGGALAETLTLAAAGGMSLDDAAGTLANTMNTFNISADKTSTISAALAGAANASTASVDSLRQGLAQVGPGAKLVGLSLNDTVAALAAFDNAGVKGSDAGTSLKTMLQNLSPQTDKAAGVMQDLGLAGFSAQKAMAYLQSKGIKPLGTDQKTLSGQLLKYVADLKGVKTTSSTAQTAFAKLANSNDILANSFFDASGKAKPLSQIAQALQDSMKGLTKEQQQNALTTMFGSDAYRAAAILAQNGAKGITKLNKATTDLSAAQKMAKTNTEGAKGTIEQLKGSVETAAIQIGTVLGPTIVDLAKSLTNLVNKFGQLSPETQKTIVMAAALAAGFGPVVSATGKTISALGDTVKAAKATASGLKTAGTTMQAFGAGLANGQSGLSAFSSKAQTFGSFLNRIFAPAFSAIKGPIMAAMGAVKAFGIALMTNPIGIAVTAIGALVGLGILLYNKWAPFRAFIDGLWASIKQLAATVAGAVVSAFQSFVAWAKNLWTSITQIASVIWGSLVGAFNAVVSAAKSVWAALQQAWNAFKAGAAIVGGIMMRILDVVTQPLQGVIQVVRGFVDVVIGLFTGNWDRVSTGIANMIAGVVRFFVGMPARIYQAIAPFLPMIGQFFVNVWNTVTSAVSTGFATVVGFFAAAPGRIIAAVSALGSLLLTWATNAITWAYRSFVNGVLITVNFMRSMPGRVAGAVASLAGLLMGKARAALSSMRSAVVNGASNVINFMRTLPGKVVSAIASLASLLVGKAQSALSSMATAVSTGVTNVLTFFRNLPGQIISGLGNVGGMLLSAGADVIRGFINGITSMAGNVIAAIRSAITDKLPSFVKSALGIASPSKVFAQLGRWTVEGFVKGVLTSAPAAAKASATLVQRIKDATTKALDSNQKALDKNAKDLVANTTKLAVNARALASKTITKARRAELQRQRDTLTQQRKTLVSQRKTLNDERGLLGKQQKQALDAIAATNKKLAPLLKQRDAVAAKLAGATANLASLKAAKEKIRAALVEKLDTGRDLFGSAFEGVLPDPAAVAKRLQDNLAQIRKFGALLKDLAKRGLSADVIQQIAAQGVEGGMRMAEVLAQSTPQQVKEINAGYDAIGKETTALSNSIASQMYDAGIKASEGIVAGLQKKKTALENAMKGLADTLVKTLETKLKIKSPSRVFAGVGDNIGAGLEVGINGRKKSVSKAIGGLARVPNSSALSPYSALAAAANPNVRVYIGDQELTHIVRTEVDDRQQAMTRQLAYGRRV